MGLQQSYWRDVNQVKTKTAQEGRGNCMSNVLEKSAFGRQLEDRWACRDVIREEAGEVTVVVVQILKQREIEEGV